MKDKKLLALIVLVLVLAALLTVYLVMSKGGDGTDSGDAETTSDSIAIARVSSDSVVALNYTCGGEEISLIREDGVWSMEGDGEFPLDTSTVSAMANTLSAITASREFARGETPTADFGFDDPLCVIDATTSSGKSITHTVGKYISSKSEYYFRFDGEDTVYTIPNTLYTAFSVTRSDLMKLDSLTTAAEGATFVSLEMTQSGESILSASPEAAEGAYKIYAALSTAECTDYKNAPFYGFDGSEYSFTINYTEPVESDGVTVNAEKSITFSVASVGENAYFMLETGIIYSFGDISSLNQLVAFAK